MKLNSLWFLILLAFVACGEQNDVRISADYLYHNIDMRQFIGKKVFYFLDSIDRLNYNSAKPEYSFLLHPVIHGVSYHYKDSLNILILFDSCAFINKQSKNTEYYGLDTSWTRDNFLKAKIKCIALYGVENHQFVHAGAGELGRVEP